MASACQSRNFVATIRRRCNSFTNNSRYLLTGSSRHAGKPLVYAVSSVAIVTAASIYLYRKKTLNIRHFAATISPTNYDNIQDTHALSLESLEAKSKSESWSVRELRFQQFASIEHEGNIYMTPLDFLESVTQDLPRPRTSRVKLMRRDVNAILRHTPTQEQGSPNLFGHILNKGIISYTEYLFLLCVLTKPRSGFRIAFNMFDTDGNSVVDMREFLVLQMVLGANRNSMKRLLRPMQEVLQLESVLNSVSRKTSEGQLCGLQNIDLDGNMVRTTLLIHFFGIDGKQVLKYEQFERFMENLQNEVLELEFKSFAQGMPTISKEQFSRILLRYTVLSPLDVEKCISRVQQSPENKGITFEEFRQFCMFLNNLDDFAIAMKFYSIAGQPVSPEEFQRAVKVCTGAELHPHIVNTVFNLFDDDGDGHLSHKEFIFIMKDRLHRGSKSQLMNTQSLVDAFKHCVKSEMKLNR